MTNPADAYRAGYEQGRHDGTGGNIAQAVMGKLRNDPEGYFAAGYHDGAAGREFQPPTQQPATTVKDIPCSKEADC